jgi:hypothetical protein
MKNDPKPIPVIKKGYTFYCGRCGASLNKTNRTELESGYCLKCRKLAKPLKGQIYLIDFIHDSNPK